MTAAEHKKEKPEETQTTVAELVFNDKMNVARKRKMKLREKRAADMEKRIKAVGIVEEEIMDFSRIKRITDLPEEMRL